MDAGSSATPDGDASGAPDAGLTPDAGLDAGFTSDAGLDAGFMSDAGLMSDPSAAMDAGDMEPASMAGMAEAHNTARANVMPAPSVPLPPLSWSDSLASTAQTWASGCQFSHSGGQYGENIYATTSTATPSEVVASWVSEAASYDYATNMCSADCGHYTQVVWRDTLRVGCGVANCSQNSPFGSGTWQLWVCDYDPPGNYIGQRPY